MHPAFYFWYKHARRRGFGPHAHGPHAWGEHGSAHGEGSDLEDGAARFGGHRPPPFGHGRHGGHSPEGRGDEAFGGFGGGGPFGVRRPLRFLGHKLELSEAQLAELARILDELKTERAQADVDHRRTIAAFADAMESATFGEARAKEGADQRLRTAERLREAVLKALGQIHALLDEEQRKRFAYLIRTGVVTI